MATHEEMMDQLQRELDGHDWYYAFSDDHNVWRRGQAHADGIKKLAEQCGRDGQRLVQAYKDIWFNPARGFPFTYPEDSTDVDKA